MKPLKKYVKLFTMIVICILLFSVCLLSREFEFLPIDVAKVSNYDLDRVVFQHIEKFVKISWDNCYENLLIIRDKRMYLIKDGFDFPSEAKARRWKTVLELRYEGKEDYLAWVNRINGKPDYIQVMDRHQEIMKNTNEEYVSSNFGVFYKNIRDKFIKEHVDKFRQVMRDRRDSDFYVERRPLPIPLRLEDATKYTDKFYTFARAKAFDGTMYSCEDADGDGVTETFLASENAGFNWGANSGPDLIIIYKNTDKDIETIIGKLANETISGSVEDEKNIIESFPKEKDISDLIKQVTPLNPNAR